MRTTSTLSRRRTNYQVALGYFLLLLITYGVTVEVAQSHGLTAVNRPNATALSDAGEQQSSNTRRSHNAECPLCQFQQQLSISLVHAPLLALTPLVRIAFVSRQTDFHISTLTVPTSDRAPPLG